MNERNIRDNHLFIIKEKMYNRNLEKCIKETEDNTEKGKLQHEIEEAIKELNLNSDNSIYDIASKTLKYKAINKFIVTCFLEAFKDSKVEVKKTEFIEYFNKDDIIVKGELNDSKIDETTERMAKELGLPGKIRYKCTDPKNAAVPLIVNFIDNNFDGNEGIVISSS